MTQEYDGGGTYFADISEAANADVSTRTSQFQNEIQNVGLKSGLCLTCAQAGGVISFNGSLVHSGHPVTKGTRYILVAFLYSYSDSDSEEDSHPSRADGSVDGPVDGSAGGSVEGSAEGGAAGVKRKAAEISTSA